MMLEYRGYRISTWVDDDTNHAQMLKGKKGRDRLYVDVDPIGAGDGRDPSSRRFSGDIVARYQFPGTLVEQLVEVAKRYVDNPEEFALPHKPAARTLTVDRRSERTPK